MRQFILSSLIFGLFLFGSRGVLRASESDQLRARAKAMQKEAAVMAEQGKDDEAVLLREGSVILLEVVEQLELHASERWEKGIRSTIDREVGHLKVKEQLQDLLAHEETLRETKAPETELAKVGKRISRVKRELTQIQSHLAGALDIPPEFHPQAENLAEAIYRIHHLRAAAQNLKMAEEHDFALQLMEKAEGMEREVQMRKVRLAVEMLEVHGKEDRLKVDPELRAKFERLLTEPKELQQILDLEKR